MPENFGRLLGIAVGRFSISVANDKSVLGLANNSSSYHPASLYHSWESDHCWRNRTTGDRALYDILVTGAGYSATGYFSKTFTSAGYPVGHEKFGDIGVSDWLMTSRKNNSYSPFLFKHIFLLVRHPLKVLHSQYGTNWDFVWTEKNGVRSDVAHDETLLSPEQFNKLSVEFKSLEWWLVYTMLGENIAECYVRAEDISARLLLNMCLRSELSDCQTKDWNGTVQEFTQYNSHNRKNDTKTWEELEFLTNTKDERLVLRHARLLCHKFYSIEEC